MNKVKIFDYYKVTDRKLPLNYDEIVGRQYIVPLEIEFQDCFLCKIYNSYVSPYGVVYKNHRVLQPSLTQYNELNNHYKTYIKKRLFSKVVKIKGLSVVFLNPHYNNFYHFTTECLTRLYAVIDKKEYVSVIINKDSPKYIYEYLKLLGFNKTEILNIDELAFCEELLLPAQTANVHKQNPFVINQLSVLLKGKVSLLKNKFRDIRNIYISRKKASYRKINNEKDIINLLEAYNFKVIDFEDFTIEESIAMMSNVKNLVGIHGAGLTNMMFMEREKLVIHLIHEGHHDDSFYNLGDVMGHSSIFIQGKGANSDDRGVCFDDFTIDIKKLSYYLRKYLIK